MFAYQTCPAVRALAGFCSSEHTQLGEKNGIDFLATYPTGFLTLIFFPPPETWVRAAAGGGGGGGGMQTTSSRPAEEQREANEALGFRRPRVLQVQQQLYAVMVL